MIPEGDRAQPLEFMVRPFVRVVEQKERPPLRYSAWINDGGLQVTMPGHVVLISTVESGRDRHGRPFARIREQRVDLGLRRSITVEPEYDEEAAERGPGCLIEFARSADRRPYQEAAGYDLREINLLVPCTYGVSIYFDRGGYCDGVGHVFVPGDPEAALFDPS